MYRAEICKRWDWDATRLKLSFGTSFGIRYIDKVTGVAKGVPLVHSSEKNIFFALFEEEDVEFQFVVDHTGCTDRDIRFSLHINDKSATFIQRRFSRGFLETLETDGEKFRFVKQSHQVDEDVEKAAPAAASSGLKAKEETLKCTAGGRAKIGVEYSKILEVFNIKVKTQTSSFFELEVASNDKIISVKNRIYSAKGISVEYQRLVLEGSKGKQLQDDHTLFYYGIKHNSTLQLVSYLRGGGLEDDTKPGEISFKERSEQCFRMSVSFSSDESILIQPFGIEMRLNSQSK